ncbi:glycine betaine ABC transporter substrate-binding protein [Brevibacillus sp. B_LB10_24]|uniref:glycine betaine ABC transporter substrate-binding protein n=1 Tax=Brevibacillus sp. B_LB10_24 TaxID=3380645 RepID=UPI0038B9ECE0
MKYRLWLFLISLLGAAMISGCSGAASSDQDTIVIGPQAITETYTLSYMIKHLIEQDTGLKAEVKEGLANTAIVHQAMQKNEVHISPRYVGTDITGVLETEDVPRDRKEAFKLVHDAFQEKYKMTWFPSYGFENTYAFTVRKDIADKLHLVKVSDLKPYSKDMKLGTDNGWLERPLDGYPAFKKVYGIEFGSTSPMDIGLVYKAVRNADVDVVLAYSTDARLKEYNLKTLEDDQNFFPPYEICTVANNSILEKHPELKDVLNKLVGLIDSETMTELNYQVDVKQMEPSEVAKNFLISKGLLKP